MFLRNDGLPWHNKGFLAQEDLTAPANLILNDLMCGVTFPNITAIQPCYSPARQEGNLAPQPACDPGPANLILSNLMLGAAMPTSAVAQPDYLPMWQEAKPESQPARAVGAQKKPNNQKGRTFGKRRKRRAKPHRKSAEARQHQATADLKKSIAESLMLGVYPAREIPVQGSFPEPGRPPAAVSIVRVKQADARLLREAEEWILEHGVDNTDKAYNTYQKQFTMHCIEEGVTRFPAKPATVVTFAKKLVNRKLSISTVGVAFAAIAAEYKPYDTLISPTESGLVGMARSVVHREAKPAGPGKLPIPIEFLVGFAQNCCEDLWENAVEVFLMILMMAAFLREGEATNLDEGDVWLEHHEGEEVLFVFVGSAKNDQKRRGHTIVVGKAIHHESICPILWFNMCMAKRPASKKFFCRANGKPMDSAEPNRILKRLLRSRPEVDASLYGSHSLRKEGCTAAAAAGVETTLLKRHGNWKSDAVFIYIKNSLKERLSVSQAFL
jgi:hypothetical protein